MPKSNDCKAAIVRFLNDACILNVHFIYHSCTCMFFTLLYFLLKITIIFGSKYIVLSSMHKAQELNNSFCHPTDILHANVVSVQPCY